MHEVSIMQSTREIAEEHARKAGRNSIKLLRLKVGLISGVEPDALAFAFDCLRKGTMAENASLEIERIPGEARCSACNHNAILEEMRFDCPECGGMLILGQAGADLELANLVLL